MRYEIVYAWNWLKAEFRWRVLGKRYEVELSELVKQQLSELPEDAREVVMKTMDRLSKNPYTRDRYHGGE